MADRSTELALPSIREVFEAFVALSPQEFGILLGVLFWAVLLVMPISRVDRRDRITQASYAAFMGFCGASLILAATRYLAHGIQTVSAMLLTLAFCGIAGLRWLIDRSGAKERTNRSMP